MSSEIALAVALQADLAEPSEAMCVRTYHLDGLLLKEGAGRWGARTQWWKRQLSLACARHVGLVWRYYRGTAKVILYGYPWQMEVCAYLYEVCARQIEKKAQVFLKERREKAAHPYWQSARAAGTEFRNGAVEGVHQLLWQQRKAAEERFKLLGEALEILGDEFQRKVTRAPTAQKQGRAEASWRQIPYALLSIRPIFDIEGLTAFPNPPDKYR